MGIIKRKRFKAHSNIYLERKQNEYDREVTVDIGIPLEGINANTGIIVLVPGYGAGINTNVYNKMKKELADKYNLITVQCDYFGNKMMDSNYPKEINWLLESPNIKSCQLEYMDITKETLEEFNDMGFMQALDIVSSSIQVIEDLKKDYPVFNPDKVILFGVSHGAYLSYLCNIICPWLYTHILDISAYLKPVYLNVTRTLVLETKNHSIQINKIQFLNKNKQYKYADFLYDLGMLYEGVDNHCKIYSFHGVNDDMTPIEEKKSFIGKINNAELMVISEDEVDGICFKNTLHGLGLDFFVFLDLILNIIEDVAQ